MIDTYYQEEFHDAIYDEWGFHDSSVINMDFLLPTGVLIELDVPRNSKIADVKELLWEEAVKYPLFNQLMQTENYVFNYVTTSGYSTVIADEAKHLSDYDLFDNAAIMNVVKVHGDIQRQKIITEIQKLVSSKDEIKLNFSEECLTFRKDLMKKAEYAAKTRDDLHWKEFLQRFYPPTLVTFHTNQHDLRPFGLLEIGNKNLQYNFDVKVNPMWSTLDLTKKVLQDVASKTHLPSVNADDYVLHSKGKEYIVGEYPLHDFQSLREALVTKRSERGSVDGNNAQTKPFLELLHVADVRAVLPQNSYSFFQPKENEPPPVPEKSGRKFWSLWQMNNPISVQVMRVGKEGSGKDGAPHLKKELVVIMGIYHGVEQLSYAAYLNPEQEDCTKWSEIAGFQMKIQDLPRSARLCITLCTTKGKIKQFKSLDVKAQKQLVSLTTPIAWVNTTYFDLRGYLRTGKMSLRLWEWDCVNLNPDNFGLYPLGANVSNCDEQAFYIELQLNEFQSVVAFPQEAEILSKAAQQAQTENFSNSSSKSHLYQLREIIKKPGCSELAKDEKQILWKLRLDCRDIDPDCLPKIVSTVDWTDRDMVAMMHALLSSWPAISPTPAMELLNIHFANLKVREFAVRCLGDLTDEDLQMYLLQLVQSLKFEAYIDNHLTRFMLERAWNNRKIGHYLFWHLRAELSNKKTSMYMWARFCLILEIYLYGNIPHLHQLFKQNEAFVKLKAMNERVKESNVKQKDLKVLGRKMLQDTAQQPSFADALSNVECPLDPNIDLVEIRAGECKVMNSKMRPLWLSFNQSDQPDPLLIIYKNGDDLRQDMLTIQMLKIMDKFWKEEGLDLKILPYRCLATGSTSGLIEVVNPAATIANIQKSKASKIKSSFRQASLLEWIEEKAEKHLISREEAIENFTLSCAGYCVATYVLGVADRHSDNIMITEKGQLFHIDFGHILGHFKSKLGIKRERVPFVLTSDFVHVINKGKNNHKTDFEKFKKLCERAYMCLRKKGHFFITLFALMMQSGLPELSSESDLNYLKESLVLHLSDEKALEHLNDKLKDSLRNAWSTSINWAFHNMARDN